MKLDQLPDPKEQLPSSSLILGRSEYQEISQPVTFTVAVGMSDKQQLLKMLAKLNQYPTSNPDRIVFNLGEVSLCFHFDTTGNLLQITQEPSCQ